MPIIIDANRCGDFSEPVSNHASDILKEVQSKKLKIALGGRLRREIAKTKFGGLILEFTRSGKVLQVTDKCVDMLESIISMQPIESDDPHILALAKISNTRLLYTEDENLIKDFKNTQLLTPKGKIITTRTKTNTARAIIKKHYD